MVQLVIRLLAVLALAHALEEASDLSSLFRQTNTLHSSKSSSGKGASSKSSKSDDTKSSGKRGKRESSSSSPSSSLASPSRCSNMLSEQIMVSVPEAFAVTPSRCCDYYGPMAVIVTHAEMLDNGQLAGVWAEFYDHYSKTSARHYSCFVMTGLKMDVTTTRSISDILIDVHTTIQSTGSVPAVMTTDPTEDPMLAMHIRSIELDPEGPQIGVFNIGYRNIIVESLVSGRDRLPFIGAHEDEDYGVVAATAVSSLQGFTSPVPLCFNGYPEVERIGYRCGAFYDSLSTELITPRAGVTCGDDEAGSTAQKIIDEGATAVLATDNCCTNVREGAVMAETLTGISIVVGCMDQDTTGGEINFVTKQPIRLQAYHVACFLDFALMEDPDTEILFPSLATFVRTNIFNEFLTTGTVIR